MFKIQYNNRVYLQVPKIGKKKGKRKLIESSQVHVEYDTFLFGSQKSVHHVEKEECSYKANLRFSLKRRYIPCIVILVWGCGYIANVRKLMNFEQYSHGKI